MTKRVRLFAFLFTITFGLYAQQGIGTISFMEGSAQVLRDDQIIGSDRVEIGFELREFDTIETADDGYVEVEMAAPSAGSLVKVQPGTAFYFTQEKTRGSWLKTTFQLLRGSLRLKVGKLRGQEAYEVQTDLAAMAVRGTEFNVDMAPDRSVLVSVPEGRVASQSETRTVMAEPGLVATVDPQANIKPILVKPDDIELYREYWQTLRLDALKSNADPAIQQFSRQWDSQLPRLKNALNILESQKAVFAKWEQIHSGNAPEPPLSTAIRDKQAISRGMLALRSILPVVERTYYTLEGLEDAYNLGFATKTFTAGNYANAQEFYRVFRQEKDQNKQLLGLARRYARLYSVIHLATGGGPDIMSGIPSF